MRGHRGFKDCAASHTVELDHCDIEIEITYNVGAYDPGGWEHPPEGGEIDDVRLIVCDIHVHDPADLPVVKFHGPDANHLDPHTNVQRALGVAMIDVVDRLVKAMDAAKATPMVPGIGTPGQPAGVRDVFNALLERLQDVDPAFDADIDRAIEWDMSHGGY